MATIGPVVQKLTPASSRAIDRITGRAKPSTAAAPAAAAPAAAAKAAPATKPPTKPGVVEVHKHFTVVEGNDDAILALRAQILALGNSNAQALAAAIAELEFAIVLAVLSRNGVPEGVASHTPAAQLDPGVLQSLVVDGGAGTSVNLPDGTVIGQEKQITTTGAFAHAITITATTPSLGWTTITTPSTNTFATPSHVRLVWRPAGWVIVSYGNVAIT